MPSPMPDQDYMLISADRIRADSTGVSLYALSSVLAKAGLDAGQDLLWEAFPDEHRTHAFHILWGPLCEIIHDTQTGRNMPLPVPPAVCAGEPGLAVTAYDLCHHPTPQLFSQIAAILDEIGRTDLAAIVLNACPTAIDQAAARAHKTQ